jgi:hypothetical protein
VATVTVSTVASCSGDALTDPPGREFLAAVNGARVSGSATTRLILRPGAPDTVSIVLQWDGNLLALKFEHHGPGRYELAPHAVDLWVFNEEPFARIGEYRGSTTTTGELVLTSAAGIGETIQGEFSVDAQHIGGVARFGLTATVRRGFVSTVL